MNEKLINLNVKIAKVDLAKIDFIFNTELPKTIGELKDLCKKQKLHCRVINDGDYCDSLELNEFNDTYEFPPNKTQIVITSYGLNLCYIYLNYFGAYEISCFDVTPQIWINNSLCDSDEIIDFVTPNTLEEKLIKHCKDN